MMLLKDLLEAIRKLYAAAAEDTQKAQEMRALVAQLPAEFKPLRLAYQAAGEALKARETWLPWEKLRYFQQAMALFEQAIALSPTQIETRFLRYTIQQNTPSILGLSVNMTEDKQVILQHIEQDATDNYMKVAIAKHLWKHEHFGIKEQKILQSILGS
jgi:DNA-binding ferritin-like protein (Dps family)